MAGFLSRRCYLKSVLTAVVAGVSIGAAKAGELPFSLEDHKGKVVYVDFWASWCIPCRASFPFMNSLHSDFPDKLLVAAVNVDANRDDADRFLAEYPADFRVFFDPTGKLAREYEVKGMPTSILFDKNGKMLWTHTGFRLKDVDTLRDAIQEVLESDS